MTKLFITLLTALSVGSVIFIGYTVYVIGHAFTAVMELGLLND